MTPKPKTRGRKTTELEAFRKIVMAINSQIDDLGKVVNLILTKACELIRADHGSLMLYRQETQTLQIAAVVGEDWTEGKQACAMPLGEGITGRVVATKEPYLCPDTKADSNYFALFDNVASELAVPVISQGRTLGVINVDSDRLGAFTQTDLDLLTMFADHAAIAIENSRQFNFTKASRERWLQIFDALPDALIIGDADFNVERANEQFYQFFKVSPDQVLGHALSQVLSLIAGFGNPPFLEDRLRQGEKIDATFVEIASQKPYRWRALRVAPGDKPVYLFSFDEREGARA